MSDFNPQEILGIAINVEISGQKLYQKLYAKTKDPAIKNICQYIIDQEQAHQRIFSDMLANYGQVFVVDKGHGEYQAYLQAISQEYIFTLSMMDEVLERGFENDEEALEFAIDIEKDSILTYTALKPYVVTAKQDILQKIIDEEQKHLVKLVSYINDLD